MPTADSSPARPAGLWKAMSEAQRRQAAEAFWHDRDSIAEQAEVMALIARKLNFRFKSVQGLPIARKVSHLMALGNVSDSVAGRLLVTYHLNAQRPMMGAFLDALGIPHEDGLIAQDETPKPDPEKLAAAAASLRTAFPPTDVDLYFTTLMLQDPETWGGLQPLVSGSSGVAQSGS
jgi:hypothetical protein